MKFALVVLTLLSVFVCSGQSASSIIPTPEIYKSLKGKYFLKSEIKLDATVLTKRNHFQLKEGLLVEGVNLNQIQKGIADIIFNQDDHIPPGEYMINVDQNIVIAYSTEESCYHSIISLLQMIKGNEGQKYISKGFVQDSPKFKWRGLHLDVSRHFYSVEDVKRFIDLMALYKFNTFHWHLTDDQGWRIEIKKYPKLTSVGAWRDSTVIGHYSDSPRKYKVGKYGGYYTQEEIKEVVNYANQKFITIVPEIEMPGHSRAILAAYPELSCSKQENEVPGLWGVFDDILCSREESIDFMKDVLDEVIELFPSDYIHIGGDEAPKTRWKECRDCQKVIRKNSLKDEHELQSHFIQQIDAFLTSRNKKLIGWDEILEGGLSPNAAVMSWRGVKGGVEAAKQGHEVVMSPTSYCYFDYYQSSHDSEPLAIGGYLPVEKVYEFNPIPSELTEEESKFIIGGQANLWTEYIPNMQQLEYMLYPRALALIQSLWCKKKPSYSSFVDTYLNHQEEFLSKRGVNYSKSIHFPQMKISRGEDGINVEFVGASEEFEFDVKVSTELIQEYYNGVTGLGKGEHVYISNSDDRLYKFHVSPVGLNQDFYYTINSTATLGAEVELLTKPHLKYNHNGSLNLVDGIRGSLPWKGSEWLGFQKEIIEMVIESNDERECGAIELGLLNDSGSWIYLPKDLKLLKSNDNEHWEAVESVSSINVSDDSKPFGINFHEKAKYYKIKVIAMSKIPDGKDGAGHVPWTFIDEIELKYSE